MRSVKGGIIKTHNIGRNEKYSTTELTQNSGDVENCFSFLLAPLLAVPGLNAIVAVVIVASVAIPAVCAIYKSVTENSYNDMLDPTYEGGVLKSIKFNKTKYELEEATENYQKKSPGQIFIAFKTNNAIYMSKMAISMKTAQDVMKLGEERLNTYTKNEKDAKKIAEISPLSIIKINMPYWHSAHSNGYFNHWHPYKGNSHSFYGNPIWK